MVAQRYILVILMTTLNILIFKQGGQVHILPFLLHHLWVAGRMPLLLAWPPAAGRTLRDVL